MTFDDVRRNHTTGAYTYEDIHHLRRLRLQENHIFDENQSVLWNREQVKIHNEDIDRRLLEANERRKACKQKFIDDLAQATFNEYNLPRDQFEVLYDYVHNTTQNPYVCYDFIGDVEEFIDFINNFLALREGRNA